MKKKSFKILNFSIFIGVFFTLFIGFYAFLTQGISLDKFHIYGVEVNGFYLSLDKKLILKIDTLDFKDLKTQDESQKLDIQTQIHYAKTIHTLLQYFQNIQLKQIKLKGYEANLLYDGENFTINFPNIYAKLNLSEKDSTILLNLQDLYLHRLGIYMQGKGSYTLKSQKLNFDGSLSFLDLQNHNLLTTLNFNSRGDFEELQISGSSLPFKDIKFLEKILPPFNNQILKEWIFDNYTMENAYLESFSFSLPLESEKILPALQKTLKATAILREAKVYFQKDISPLINKEILLEFKNNTLEFHPKSPTYENIPLQNSKVAIKNILSDHAFLEINLHANTPLSSPIHKILESYHISLPLKQLKSNTNATLYLGLDLHSLNLTYKGIFSAKNASFDYKGIVFDGSEFLIKLENPLIDVKIQNLTYQNFVKANPHFIINTKTHKLSGDLEIVNLELQNNLLSIQNHLLPFMIDFNNPNFTYLNLPTFNIEANLSHTDTSTFYFKDLKPLIAYSSLLQDYNIEEGNIEISTKDFSNFLMQLNLISSLPFIYKKDNPNNELSLTLEYSKDILNLKTNDNLIQYSSSKNQKNIFLQDYVLDLDKLSFSNNADNLPTHLKAQNSIFIFKELPILADNLEATLNKDILDIKLSHKNGKATIKKSGEKLQINANSFGDEFVNSLAKKQAFSNGIFSLNATSNPEGILIGELNFYNTSIKQLKVLQNLLAFLDTIPSLLSLKSPGFNNEGYLVKEGKMNFGLNEDYLAINNLDIKGSSMDLQGNGVLDLKNKIIDLNTKLITIKSLSNIINKIPVVNYIFLGKDGTISTGVKISGNLDNPKITTQTAQDILLSPFNVLKRVVTSPIQIFKKD